MGGSNEKSNLVELTVEEHALAHKQLYEIYGKNEDYIAWKMLEGKDAECESQRIILAKEGFKKFMLSENFENFKQNISNSLKGKKQSIESNLKRSISLKKAHQEKRHSNPFSKKDKEYFRELYEKTNGAERLANGRKKSKKWKDSVTSEEYKLKKCLSDPRSKQIEYNGILYPSIRNAAKSLNISYSKMRSLLNKK
jgi:hypothetical protein